MRIVKTGMQDWQIPLEEVDLGRQEDNLIARLEIETDLTDGVDWKFRLDLEQGQIYNTVEMEYDPRRNVIFCDLTADILWKEGKWACQLRGEKGGRLPIAVFSLPISAEFWGERESFPMYPRNLYRWKGALPSWRHTRPSPVSTDFGFCGITKRAM